uniref:MADF domain-containing protein n=1 Tax=Steinernema glaseri TaxID=37863 RepID=A0A1I7Y3K6_9BILA
MEVRHGHPQNLRSDRPKEDWKEGCSESDFWTKFQALTSDRVESARLRWKLATEGHAERRQKLVTLDSNSRLSHS